MSFDEYIAFMAREHADAETSAQLLDAFKVLAGDKVMHPPSKTQLIFPALRPR